MWLTNGHSLGRKVPPVSSAIAWYISESFLVYFWSNSGLSPYEGLAYYYVFKSFEVVELLLKNLSSVPTQKYETERRMIFSSIASLLSSWLLSICRFNSSKLIGSKCITLPIFKLYIQSSYSLTPKIVFTFDYRDKNPVSYYSYPFLPLVL